MFVPGDRQKMIDKAMGAAVDAIMMDIEDGVAPAANRVPLGVVGRRDGGGHRARGSNRAPMGVAGG